MSFTRPPIIPAWAATGDKASQPSDTAIQTGWPLSSVPPSRQLFNWLDNFLANGLRYLMTRGIADWDAGETYAIGALVVGDDNQLYRSLQNSNAGNTPSSSPAYWDLYQSTAQLAASGAIATTGDVCHSLTVKSGWLVRDGGTIGDASSSASSRANADTYPLFALLWALDSTEYPIYTSAGSLSSRGASAAADFAAHKRMTLPNDRGRHDQGLNSSGSGINPSGTLGASQAGQAGSVTAHMTGTIVSTTGSGFISVVDSLTTGTEEVRVASRLYLPIIKL